jgi:hypothetical protein
MSYEPYHVLYHHLINQHLCTLLRVRNEILVSVINQIDVQKFCFTLGLFHASTCFEHMCLSSGGQNCITQPLVLTNLMHKIFVLH